MEFIPANYESLSTMSLIRSQKYSINLLRMRNSQQIGKQRPIFKKGDKNVAANYRPISLTSIICKLMESFIKEDLQHLSFSILLTKCANIMANKGMVDSIYFDFAKAFGRLKKKLNSYGINGQIGKWIDDFLTNRSQLVRVTGSISDSVTVLSGIPQGSVLGPIFFIVYIKDLPDVVKSTMYLFADDTKLMKEIESIHDILDLQKDILEMDVWSTTWLIKFNLEKCHVLTLGKPKLITHPIFLETIF